MPEKFESAMNRKDLRNDPLPHKRRADACVGFVSTNDIYCAPSRAAYPRPEEADAMVPGDGRA